MESENFPIVVEQDEDVWRACVPGLESRGHRTAKFLNTPTLRDYDH